MYQFRKKRSYSKVSNAQGIVKIFRLGAKLQLFIYNNGITFKISQLLIVGHIQRFVLGRKVTLRTLCTYDHLLRTFFMKRRPDLHLDVEFVVIEDVFKFSLRCLLTVF